jgi:hypothetical protein
VDDGIERDPREMINNFIRVNSFSGDKDRYSKITILEKSERGETCIGYDADTGALVEI